MLTSSHHFIHRDTLFMHLHGFLVVRSAPLPVIQMSQVKQSGGRLRVSCISKHLSTQFEGVLQVLLQIRRTVGNCLHKRVADIKSDSRFMPNLLNREAAFTLAKQLRDLSTQPT